MNDKISSIFSEVLDKFSQSDWNNWVKGKVNLFDVYMKKIGVSEEEVQIIRKRHEPVKKEKYQDFIDNPVTISKKQKNK